MINHVVYGANSFAISDPYAYPEDILDSLADVFPEVRHASYEIKDGTMRIMFLGHEGRYSPSQRKPILTMAPRNNNEGLLLLNHENPWD